MKHLFFLSFIFVSCVSCFSAVDQVFIGKEVSFKIQNILYDFILAPETCLFQDSTLYVLEFPSEYEIETLCNILDIEKSEIIPIAGTKDENEDIDSLAIPDLIVVNRDLNDRVGDVLVVMGDPEDFKTDDLGEKLEIFLTMLSEKKEQAQTDTAWRQIGNLYWASYSSYPYGEIWLQNWLYLALNDGDPNHKFIVIKPKFVAIPGKVKWNTSYWNYRGWSELDTDKYSQNYHLQDWGPVTTGCQGTFSINLAYNNVGFSYSFSIPPVSFRDYTEPSWDDARVKVFFQYASSAAKSTFSFWPSALVMTPQNYWYFQGDEKWQMTFTKHYGYWGAFTKTLFLSRYYYGAE
ncbi:hypothetical protein EH221_05745 [bacterium]|nr:MAG: hypothetical protein EH221_05745 [bacterium]